MRRMYLPHLPPPRRGNTRAVRAARVVAVGVDHTYMAQDHIARDRRTPRSLNRRLPKTGQPAHRDCHGGYTVWFWTV